MVNLDNITPTNFIEDEIYEDLKSGRSKEVVTRCPPEPSGYWHIGHCKAWMIDFETAIKFGGVHIPSYGRYKPKQRTRGIRR